MWCGGSVQPSKYLKSSLMNPEVQPSSKNHARRSVGETHLLKLKKHWLCWEGGIDYRAKGWTVYIGGSSGMVISCT